MYIRHVGIYSGGYTEVLSKVIIFLIAPNPHFTNKFVLREVLIH